MNTEDNSCNKSFSLEGGWATNSGIDQQVHHLCNGRESFLEVYET
jgi:hypothetical protein